MPPLPTSLLRPGCHFQVHWLSIINSFVLVVLLTVFLSIILVRVIKNDFTRCCGGFRHLTHKTPYPRSRVSVRAVEAGSVRDYVVATGNAAGDNRVVKAAAHLCVGRRTHFHVCVLTPTLALTRCRYMSAGEEGDFVDEETGWKLIHGL